MSQPSAPNPTPAPASSNLPPDDKEEIYYEGSPSVYSSASHLFLYALLALILIAAAVTVSVKYSFHWALLAVPVGIVLLLIPSWLAHSIRYRISNYRIDYERGLLSKDIDSLELWHIEDVSFHQSLFDRLANIGDITVLSHDDTTPQLVLRGLPNPRPLFESLKQRVITVKRQRGVIKMDPGN
jgi:hypothetical protein